MWIYIKEQFNISNEAWHKLALKTRQMPNIYKIEKKVKELNATWNFKTTPGEAEGVQMNFKESVEEQIIWLQEKGVLIMNTGAGVAGILKRKNLHFVNVHCVAHRLALCSSQAAENVPGRKQHQEVLGAYYSISLLRYVIAMHMQFYF